ncbi:hypothetical protein LCGC14_2944610 [marine sediment metagenome]|uniref:Uncharacterized protein n=1 Tax=marine sediment metagenome TaxID=412755 RepID=A0A0F8Y454_9ZZZZ
MPVPSDQKPLLAQIDDELQLIQKKLADESGTGVTLAAHIATATANELLTNTATDLMTTNLAVTDALLDALVLSTGDGLGVIADVPLDDTLHVWIAAAIVTET